MIKFKILAILLGCILLIQCQPSSKKIENSTIKQTVNFGNIVKTKISEVISDYSFIHLETTEESLIGGIGQIEIYKDNIFILDDRSNNVLVFSIDGKFIHKFTNRGNGPGEFITPTSFYIDKKGYFLLFDTQLNRILKYDLMNLKFIKEIKMPFNSAKSFFVLPDDNLYLYYANKGSRDYKYEEILNISDEKGVIHKKLLKATPSEKVFHGSLTNFYYLSGNTYFYPHFSNKIYLVTKDSIQCKYEMFFGDSKIVDQDLFLKNKGTIETFNEIMTNGKDWIRLLYVYENEKYLVVKYYIKKDFYTGIYNKESRKVINFKQSDVLDDIGIGGKFPLPIGVNGNQFISQINLFDINKKSLKIESLRKYVEISKEDSNPILMLYSIKNNLGNKQ
jgi:hypothetical protein